MYPGMRKETGVVSFMPDEAAIARTTFHPVKWGPFIVRGLIALIIGILVLISTGSAVQVVATLLGILIRQYDFSLNIFNTKVTSGVLREEIFVLGRFSGYWI